MLSLLTLIADPAKGSGAPPLESRAAAGAGADFDSLFAAAAGLLGQEQGSTGDAGAGTAVPALPLERQRVADDSALLPTENPAGDESTFGAIPAVSGPVPVESAASLAAMIGASSAGSAENPVTDQEHAATLPAARTIRQLQVARAVSSPAIDPDTSAGRRAGDRALAQAVAAMAGGGAPEDSIESATRIAPGAATSGAAAMTDRAAHAAPVTATASTPAVPAASPGITAAIESAAAAASERTAASQPAKPAGEGTPAIPLTETAIRQPLAVGPGPAAASGVEREGAANAGIESALRPIETRGTGGAYVPNAAALPLTGSRGSTGSGADADPAMGHDASRRRDDGSRSFVALRTDPGASPEPARVRQAAEVMRQWNRAAAATDAASGDLAARLAAASTQGPVAHAPAPAPSSAPALTTAGAASDAGTLTLADGQATAEQLVQRVLQGQARHSSSVRFQLSPAELGDLQVHMQRHGDRVDIAFTATHAGARDLIESCLPNLRALLQDVGVELADVDVRHEARDQARSGGQAGTGDEGGRTGRGLHGGHEAVARDEGAPVGDARIGTPTHRPGGFDAFA